MALPSLTIARGGEPRVERRSSPAESKHTANFSRWLKLVSLLGSIFRTGQDFRTLIGHHHRVFELCTGAAILCPHGPAIDLVAPGVSSAGIDHRFDGKTHAGVESIDTALAVRKVRNRRVEMELPTESVTDVLADDAKAPLLCFGDNRFSDPRHRASRRQSLDRQVHAVEGALRHASMFFRDVADQKRLTLISMPTLNDRGDVDIHDVSVAKRIVSGDTVTDYLIDACAAAFGIVLVAQCCRFVAVINGPLIDHLIEVPGGDSLDNVGAYIVHQHRVDTPGAAHRFLLVLIENQFFLLLQHHVPSSVRPPESTEMRSRASTIPSKHEEDRRSRAS